MTDIKHMPDDDNSNPVTLKRSYFNIMVVVAIAALMVSSFFGGYILSAKTSGLGGTNTIVQQGGEQQQQPSSAAAPSPPPTTAPAGEQQPPAPPKVQSVSIEDGDPIKGKPDAPITMVEFADFQCPFCARYAIDTFPQIEKEYISSGKVKYVYKDFPLDFHPNAKPAAVAAECANEQGKFWEYHGVLFKNQTTWENQDANSTAATTFKNYAADLGLNTADFNTCFDAKEPQAKIDKDTQVGSQYGVTGTPTFYVGNEKAGYTQLVGAQPFTTFKTTIDQLLTAPSPSPSA
jgi:protein-disulfide isomerase